MRRNVPSLSRLRLTRFRSYLAAELRFNGGVVAFTGPNGAGKTNILEAISLLAPGRGLRGAEFVCETIKKRVTLKASAISAAGSPTPRRPAFHWRLPSRHVPGVACGEEGSPARKASADVWPASSGGLAVPGPRVGSAITVKGSPSCQRWASKPCRCLKQAPTNPVEWRGSSARSRTARPTSLGQWAGGVAVLEEYHSDPRSRQAAR